MNKPKLYDAVGPEAKIQHALIKFLEDRGWFVRVIHGNMYQSGLPDLFACQRKYGTRWIEVKNPLSYKFQPSQLITFPRMMAEGVGVWILTAATQTEYDKLFKGANWYWYLDKSVATL